MINLHDKAQCCGCSSCVSACPAKCIEMIADTEGFLYPSLVYPDKCVNCQKCVEACPINRSSKIKEPMVWAAINTDSDIRNRSTSGGIFYLLAKTILDNNGIVFGAAFDDAFTVKHIAVTDVAELSRIMGSKYSQSDIGDVYLEAKIKLENRVMVMFSGTPCQISGLKSFLKKEYDNLFCVDIICHGVPSPYVWKEYVEYRESKANSKTKKITFRNKGNGWKNYSVLFEFENDTSYLKKHQEDAMMRAFLNDLCLRPYCHKCEFKGDNRSSDITLADFWGIENVMPEFDDDNGVSLVFVNSCKGREIFESLRDNVLRKKCEISIVKKYNRSYYCSASFNKQRASFMKRIFAGDFDKTVRKYCDITLLKRINVRIRRILRIKDSGG